MAEVNPKVTFATGGAAGGAIGGVVIGSSIADLLATYLTQGLGLVLTQRNMDSIETLTQAAVAGVAAATAAFFSGYFKKDPGAGAG
jgi:hypothetical protein